MSMVESVRINFKGEDNVSPALTRIHSGINSLSSGVDSVGKTFSDFNKKLLIGFTAIATAVTAIGIKAVKSFGEFDKQIRRVQVLAGGTEEDFKKLADTAFKLGSSTAFSAQEVAQAFEEFAKAGFNVNQILRASESTLGLATAGNVSLAEAVSISVAAMNSFQRDAEDMNGVATVLTTTFTNSAQSLQDLGEALKIVGPLASSLGISLEEVSAALGTLANVGIKGSLAGTSLNQALLQLLSPTDDSAEAMENLGVNFFTLNEAGQAAKATIQATRDEFSSLKDKVRQSDIELALLGSKLAEAKRQMKAFGDEAKAPDKLSSSLSGLQSAFDEARLKNTELRESLEAQEKTLQDLRKQVTEGQQEFVGLRDATKQLNDAFQEIDASTVQKATTLVKIFEVRGARAFLTLTKELDNFNEIFKTIASTEIRTELLDESSLKAALSAQDSFSRQFGITFEKLTHNATKVPEGIDEALKNSKLDERARDIFRNMRSEVNALKLDSESIEAVLSDFLPLDSVKDFREIIQLTDADFENFLLSINALNQDAQTLNKTLLQNLGSAFEELQDTVTTSFIRIGGAIAQRLNLSSIVKNIQQAVEDFSTGDGIEKLADKIVNVIRLIQSFLKGVGEGFKQVFTPDILDRLKSAFGTAFSSMQSGAESFGTVVGRVLGSVAKGGAELITRVLNSNLIENASNMFSRLGNVLEKIGPTVGAVAAGFVLLTPILTPIIYVVSKIFSGFGLLINILLSSGKAIGALAGGTAKLTTGLAGITAKVTGVGSAATTATATTGGFLAKLGTIGSSIGSIFTAIGSALGVSAGVAAAIVVAIIGTIIGFVNQVRQNFLGLGDDFRTIFGFIGGVLTAIGAGIKESLIDIGTLIKPIWEGIKETFNGLGKILASLVAVVVKPFANSIRDAGDHGFNTFEIIKNAVSFLFTPLKLVLTIVGSVLKAIGAILNFVGDLIGGIVEFGFIVADAFKRFKDEGFSAFNEVGEAAKRIGVSILTSFISAIDSIINIFIDLINELIKVAKKIPLLNKAIGEDFKLDKNVLGNLTGFTKDAQKTTVSQTNVQQKSVSVTSYAKASSSALAQESASVTKSAVQPFKQATIDVSDLGIQAASNFTMPFKDPVTSAQSKSDVLSVFPTNAQASQMGRNFGAAFFTGLSDGMKATAAVFDSSIKPIFASMISSLKEFIAVFIRDLYVLRIVPAFMQNLVLKIHTAFVSGWHHMFLAVIDVTEKAMNGILTNLGKFYNQLVSVVNKLIAEYNRAADILSRDITRTTYKTVTDKKGNTKRVAQTETLFKGVNVQRLNQFSPVQLTPLKLERPALPQAPSVAVDAGGFSVNIQNFNAGSESDKQKLFSEIDAYIARQLGQLVRI
ncbi:phage tail tape measure protein [Candidatus Woesearchaeota archaeon CG08_land_8_20_14_0_20_43_7]|nr:MAG: phage tail tape measure protein [Candidatus Woesearchaeota archaeon CG08_land_8_20_14_0_20_43_7]